MKFIQGFERLMVSLMMLAVILVCGDLYLTMDRRQAQFETKVTNGLNSIGVVIGGVADARMASLADEVHGQLSPVSKHTVTLLAALTKQVYALDVTGLNTGVATTLSAATGTANGVTAAVADVSTLAVTANRSAVQINSALPDFLDCQYDETGIGNKNCLYVRYGDISSSLDRALSSVSAAAPSIAASVDKTASAVAAAAPKTADAVQGMADDGKEITGQTRRWIDKELKPPTLMEKIQGWLETFSLIIVKLLGI